MSTEEKDAWYHCGHCGSLFQSNYGFDEERVCEYCKRKPGVGIWPAVKTVKPVVSDKVAGFNKTGEKVRKIDRKPSKRDHRMKIAIRIAMIWILLLVGVIVIREILPDPETRERTLTLKDLDRDLTEKDREKILSQVLPECEQVLRGFLASTSHENRSGFIANSVDRQLAMEAHYQEHPFPKVDLPSLQRTAEAWLHHGNEWMVLTHWKDEAGGLEFDAVFRHEPDGWRLDWPHFTRYSIASWQQFIVGEGKHDQAEFRLLVRKHEDDQPAAINQQRIMVVLAEPVWGKPNEARAESPILFVDAVSDQGLWLNAAFEARQKNLSFGNIALKPLCPEGFVMARVRVVRDELGGEYRYALNEIKAGHWLDSEITGF